MGRGGESGRGPCELHTKCIDVCRGSPRPDLGTAVTTSGTQAWKRHGREGWVRTQPQGSPSPVRAQLEQAGAGVLPQRHAGPPQPLPCPHNPCQPPGAQTLCPPSSMLTQSRFLLLQLQRLQPVGGRRFRPMEVTQHQLDPPEHSWDTVTPRHRPTPWGTAKGCPGQLLVPGKLRQAGNGGQALDDGVCHQLGLSGPIPSFLRGGTPQKSRQ